MIRQLNLQFLLSNWVYTLGLCLYICAFVRPVPEKVYVLKIQFMKFVLHTERLKSKVQQGHAEGTKDMLIEYAP